jgi:hypothetical protein
MTRIALVGHCGVDGPRIEAAILSVCDTADIASIHNPDALARVVDDGVELLLFNRELGYGFGDEGGVDVMTELRRDNPTLKMMLISDRPDAQAAAKKVGALPGFGKADLGTSRVEKALRNALDVRE